MSRSQSSQGFAWKFAGGVIVAAGLLVGGVLLFQPATVKIELEPISRQTVKENEAVEITPVAHVKGASASLLRYGILSGPPGAKIDAKTGVFTWTPSESQGPKKHDVEIGVKTSTGAKAQATRKFSIVVQEVNEPPVLADIEPQQVEAGQTFKLVIQATDHDEPSQTLDYQLGKQVPSGARLDPRTGEFEWTPPETSDEHDENVDIVVSEVGEHEKLQAKTTFKIHVTALSSPADRLTATIKAAGFNVVPGVSEVPPGFTGTQKAIEVGDQTLTILEYETPAAAEADLKQISNDGQTVFGKPYQWTATTRLYHTGQLLVLYSGTDYKLQQTLEKQLKSPVITAKMSPPDPTPEKTEPVKLSVSERLGKELAALHKEKKLLNKKEYATIRNLFARQFEERHTALLKTAFETDAPDLKKWLDDHPDHRDEFYIAIAPEDDLPNAIKILAAMHRKFARQLADYFPLAIATAVTWDNDAAIYDFSSECRRTHAIYPEKLLSAVENFEYFIETEKAMQGRAQYLPWEFLKHLINHRTTREERLWALDNYGGRREGYGKCYSQVPYDYEMLRTESKVCKLDGKDYILPNLLQFGGVCSQQADFAARVGKSIGVPAEYVTGQGKFGGHHAWVMWVELKQVTKSGIAFSLESHGRYFGDNYYVGNITEPQTGSNITDRELELRLHAVGLNPLAYRQTNMIMSAYPVLRDEMKWDAKDEIIFLNDVIEMSPGNEPAWQAVAHLARDGKVETASYRLMNIMFGKLFTTFAKFPDFTWTVFDDLVAFQKNAKQRNRYFEQLVAMYETGGRPDLACEARLKLSDYLLEEGKTKEVIAGLAFTIKKFPDEGLFVPKLLDRLELVAADMKGAEAAVLDFYRELIPMIPPKRGNDVSDYYVQMLRRASDRFKTAGQLQQAQTYAEQADRLKPRNN